MAARLAVTCYALYALSAVELLERFPAGEYRFLGRGIEGEKLVGSATLTHDLPDGPTLLYPLEDSGPVDRFNTVLMWEPVAHLTEARLSAIR